MKEGEPHVPEWTARDAAKALLRPYVLRGDDPAWLASGPLGAANPVYWAQLGGSVLVASPDGAPARSVALTPTEVAVTRLHGRPVFARFSLPELWQEIQREARGGERQGRLF